MRFDDTFKIVLGFEGGYSNDPNDRDGDKMLKFVCIDPGHGGHDPGVMDFDRLCEKDVT